MSVNQAELPEIPKVILDLSRAELAKIVDKTMSVSVLEFLELNKSKVKRYDPLKDYPSADKWSSFLQEINPVQLPGVENRRQLCIDVGTTLEKHPENLQYNYDSVLNQLLRPAASYFALISTLETSQHRMNDLQRKAQQPDADPMYYNQFLRTKIDYLKLIAKELPNVISNLSNALNNKVPDFKGSQLDGALQSLQKQSLLSQESLESTERELKKLEEAEVSNLENQNQAPLQKPPKKFSLKAMAGPLLEVTHLFNVIKKPLPSDQSKQKNKDKEDEEVKPNSPKPKK